jgi:hypothetical protein
MPLVKEDLAARLYTESVLNLLVQGSRSEYVYINPADTLELMFKEVLLPAGHVPLNESERQKIRSNFQQRLTQWPKSINADHRDWFNQNLLMPYTSAVLQSPVVGALADGYGSGDGLSSRLKFLMMQRLGNWLIQESPQNAALKEDVKLCLDWTELSEVDDIKRKLTQRLEKFIIHHENTLSKRLLKEAKKTSPNLLDLFDALNGFMTKVRTHYLFDKIEDAEKLLERSIERLKNKLSTESSGSLLSCLSAHLDLTDEQRAIQRGLIGLMHNLSRHERGSVVPFFKAIINHEFQYKGKGLTEFNLDVLERIALWEPKTTDAGILRFKELFIDYYIKPVAQLFKYYQISELTPEDQADFASALIRYNLERLGVKPDVKIQCLLSWLQWYPQKSIKENQTQVTWQIINSEWEKFDQSKSDSFKGFAALWETLAANPVFQFDYEAVNHFYTLVQQKMRSNVTGEFRAYLESMYPEFLYDAPQFWLFVSSQHLLELIQNKVRDPKDLLMNILNGTLGRIFFDFPVCKTHDETYCMDDVFFHHSLVESFAEKLDAWSPQMDEESVDSFVQSFIMYYAAPFFANPGWKNYWNRTKESDFSEQCEKFLQAALVYKILTTWTKYHPDEAIRLVNKIQCLSIWINNYPVDSIAQAQNSVIERMIDNALKDFTSSLLGNTERLSIKKMEEVGPAFQSVLTGIRNALAFQASPDAESILYSAVRNYMLTLKESAVKPKFITKVKDAILADNRLSIDEEQMLKMSLKHPWKAFQLWSTKSEETKRELVRRQSEGALRADIVKKEKKQSPKMSRKAEVTASEDNTKQMSSRSKSMDVIPKPAPKKTSPHLSRSIFTKGARDADARLDESKKSKSFPS